jgi:hypothetical protein
VSELNNESPSHKRPVLRSRTEASPAYLVLPAVLSSSFENKYNLLFQYYESYTRFHGQ